MEDFSKNQDFLKLSSNESRENFDLKTECDFFVENVSSITNTCQLLSYI